MKPLSLTLIAMLVLAGCNRSHPAPAEVAPADKAVVASVRVDAAVTPRHQAVTATVRPADRAAISARIMGRVERIHVPIGGRAKAGDILVTLEASEIGARLEQARAALDEISRDLAREASLVKQGASSAETARTLEDRHRAATAAVNEAAALASYTTITAPFDGVVTRRAAEAGDLATPGSVLLELEGLDRLRAEANVPESLPLLPLHADVSLQLDGTTITGSLVELSPAADPVSRTRLAKVELPAGSSVRSGQFVRVLWPAGETPHLWVPASAVTRFGQMERVWVVADGRVHLRLVRTGMTDGDRIEVLAGVSAGEQVVIKPSAALRDGQAVSSTP